MRRQLPVSLHAQKAPDISRGDLGVVLVIFQRFQKRRVPPLGDVLPLCLTGVDRRVPVRRTHAGTVVN